MQVSKRIRAFAVFVFVALFMVSTALSKVSFHYIRKLIRKRDYRSAEELLISSLDGAKGSDYYRVLLMMAGIETSLQKVQEYYRRIIAGGTNKEVISARVELAKIYYAIGDYSRAISLLDDLSSSRATRSYLEGLFFKALTLRQLGRFDEARESFEKIDRGRFLYPSYMALAELDMQDGNIDAAVGKFEMIAAEHSNPVAGFKLGECYEIKGKREKALVVYRTVLQKFPKSLEAARVRAKISSLVGGNVVSSGPEEKGELKKNDRNSMEGAYTIQFGAFSERANAARMVDDLEKLDIKAWIEDFNLNGTVVYRVRCGRYDDRGKAEKDAAKYQKKLGLNCRVLPLR